MWDSIEAAFRARLLLLSQTATLRVPIGEQDEVGQPTDAATEITGVPVYLASTPHQSEYENKQVSEDTNWQQLYVDANAGVEPVPGTVVEVFDANGNALGVFVVEGDPARRPGHWLARVRRQR